MNWKLMKLGALLTQSKEMSTAPDANRRIRVKLNVGGVEKRPVSNEVEGATNYYIRKAGQFIFGTQNFHKGAFGVIPPELDGFETSNDIPSFDVSKDCLPDWIFFYFKVGDRYKELEKLARGVGSKRVHAKQIFELEIPVPPVAEQLTIIEQVQASAARQRMIVEESEYQLAHLTQLRQALLREAMQGQLLPQDPTDEPAAVLLQQLQAAVKPSKKGRGQAGALFAEEVEAVEGPFEIPASWAWRPLKDVFNFIDYRGKTPVKSAKGVRLITAKNIRMGFIANEPIEFMSEEDYRKWMTRGYPQNGDLVFITEGHTMGFVAQIQLDYPFALAQRTITLQPFSYEYSKWFFYAMQHEAFQKSVKQNATGSAAMGIQSAKLKELLLPLPPLAEQHRIVAKLEQLLGHCDALEQRIRESRRLAEQLLATALREALAPPTGATLPEVELAEVETHAHQGRRATAGKQRRAPVRLGPLFD